MTVQNPPIFVQEGSHPAEDTRRGIAKRGQPTVKRCVTSRQRGHLLKP